MNRAALRRMRDSINFEGDVERTDSVRAVFDQLTSLSNSEAFVRLTASNGSDGYRHDSQTLPFFARQLEQVMTEVEREEFADLPFANGELVFIDRSMNEGVRTFVWYTYSSVGQAAFASAYSTGLDMPVVHIKGAEQTGKVRDMHLGYSYDVSDLRAAAQAGMPIEGDLAMAARRGHDELLHRTAAWGREEIGLPGLYNHPNITVQDPAASSAVPSSTLWADKSADEMIADVANLINGVEERTFGKERVDTVLLSRERYNLLSGKRIGPDTSDRALKHLQERFPEVDFRKVDDLKPENSDGNLTSGHSIFAYTRKNRRKLRLIAPMAFRQHAVQQRGLRFLVPCESSTGGILLKKPKMCARMDGI